jgi:DNA-binding NtrC family response regulator
MGVKGKILLVDDDDAIRQLIGKVLEASGYSVTLAAGLLEATEACGRETFDLLLCDVVMPDGNGAKLARQIAASCPGTRVVLMTGFHDGSLHLEPDWVLLEKPFSPAVVTGTVSELLGRPTTRTAG